MTPLKLLKLLFGIYAHIVNKYPPDTLLEHLQKHMKSTLQMPMKFILSDRTQCSDAAVLVSKLMCKRFSTKKFQNIVA